MTRYQIETGSFLLIQDGTHRRWIESWAWVEGDTVLQRSHGAYFYRTMATPDSPAGKWVGPWGTREEALEVVSQFDRIMTAA